MENATVTAAKNAAAIGPPDYVTPVLTRLYEQGATYGINWASVFSFINDLWSIYAILAYILAGIFIYGFVYASIRQGQIKAVLAEGVELQEKLYRKHHGAEAKNNRWLEVLDHSQSSNPNDWRLAIIEADIMLEDALKQLGYAGTTLGERLKSITPSQLQSIDDAWTAHRIRNEIAHAGADFVLTQKLARETIGQYQRTFEELGIL